jgi:catechol 2,3-dioxygenase-like lactoylglutathione lyase family enzyme
MTGSSIKAVAEIVINVRDISAMTNFYREVLGFAFHSQFPETDPTFVFLTIAALDSPLGRGGHPQLFALVDPRRHAFTSDAYLGLDNDRSPLNHLAFEIDSAAFTSEMRRLEALDLAVRVFDFPHMQAKGLFFNDPEGNLIELICHTSQVEKAD